MSQTNKILKHLEKGKRLTPLQALKKFDCFRLSGRILDLRKLGINVKTEMIKVRSGKRVASYYIPA